MHRCSSGFLLALAAAIVVALTGCLGKGSSNPSNGGVTSVTLSPGSTISLDTGATQVFSASGRDANGRTVLGVNIQYLVGVPLGTTSAAPLTIASNGNACAGTWDASVAICSPGTPGIATVQAVINGISSPVTTVYVHQHIASIQIEPAESQAPQYECFSQGQIWQFQGIAYDGSNPPVDITNSVGPMNWSANNSAVALLATSAPGTTLLPNQVQVTARTPGITNLFASVSGTTSAPYAYTTCLIQAIYLQIGGQGQAGNSITVNNGASVNITATAIDTLYEFTGATLKTPPLTWSTTHPEVASFGGNTNSTGNNTVTTRANFGGTTVFASCTPPTCNVGVLPGLPIYSSDGQQPNQTQGYGAISIDVVPNTTAKPTTYTAWAATTGCQDAPGCSSALFAVTPGLTPIGIIVNVPRTPNSMMFNHSSSRLYFGSDQGLMYTDLTASSPSVTMVSNASVPCNVALCGKLLTVSDDGKLVVVSDTASTPSQVYIYNGGGASTPVDLILSNAGETATAATFSPDLLKLFILTNLGNMYVYSTVDALTSVSTFAPGTDVEFSADGSFAYVAGAPASAGAPANAVSAYSTCSLPDIGSVDIGSVATSSTPLQIFPSPVLPPPFEQNGPPPFQQDSFFWTTQNIIALEPPNIELLTAEFTQNPIPYPAAQGEPLQLTCNPPLILSFTKGASFNLGQPNFTPVYTQLVGDGTELLIVAGNIPAVLLFNVGDGTTTSIPLVGNANPLSASATTDGTQVYVAACDQYPNNDPTQPCAAGSVHIVNTVSQGDYQQVPYVNINNNNNPNMCNSQGTNAPLCLPNLIAIKPQ